MYNCIIIDDQSYAADTLGSYIAAYPLLRIKAVYADPIQALFEISSGEKVDGVFMDIVMPRMSGLELAGQIRNKTEKLIFCTSYKQFGYEAYEVSADAYLLKPYGLETFLNTVRKLFPSADTDPSGYFFIKDARQPAIRKIHLTDISAVVSEGNLIALHHTAGITRTRMTLSEFRLESAGSDDFYQIHRGVIIAVPFIVRVGENELELANGLKFKVGQTFTAGFKKMLKQKTLPNNF